MKKKQKTILVLVWNLDIGGVQKRVSDLVFYLNKHHPNYQVELLIRSAYPTPLLNEVKKLKKVHIHFRTKTKKKLFFPSIFWLAKNYLLLKPDIVLTFLDRLSIQMSLLKRIFFWQKTKLILNESIHTSNYLRMYEKWFWKKLVKIFYPLADKIIVPTKAIKNDLKNNFHIDEEKISVVPHWFIEFKKDAKVSKSSKKTYDFIYLGRLEKEKNIFTILSLIQDLKKQFPQISCCLLGKGSLEKEILQEIKNKKLGQNVFFYGFQKNTVQYLKKAKAFLLPSSNEGMSNSLLEAAAYQLPVLVYNFPGADEVVVDAKTGFIAKNKQELSRFSQKLLRKPWLIKKMGQKAQNQVLTKFGKNNLKKFTEEVLIQN